jgi:hypothetical protein
MADRRVVRDELLLDEVCGVQAGSEGLQSDEARHKTRQSLPSRQFSKRGHARTCFSIAASLSISDFGFSSFSLIRAFFNVSV